MMKNIVPSVKRSCPASGILTMTPEQMTAFAGTARIALLNIVIGLPGGIDEHSSALWTMKRKSGSYEPDEMIMNAVVVDILENRYKDRAHGSQYVFPNSAGDVISKNTLDKIMGRLCEKAKIKPFTFLAIRHHVSAVMADSKRLSLIEIQKQLRHKRATTTDIYLKSLVKGKNRAANVLEKAQKKVFHTKVHTHKTKNGTNSN